MWRQSRQGRAGNTITLSLLWSSKLSKLGSKQSCLHLPVLPNLFTRFSITIFNTQRENKKSKSRKYVNLMKICVLLPLLLVFVALLLAVSMEKWKSCTFRYRTLFLSLAWTAAVGKCQWVWVWAWVASCSRGASKLIGFSATARHGCCLNKFGALIMLYTSSSPSSTPCPLPLVDCSRSVGQALLGFPRAGPHQQGATH